MSEFVNLDKGWSESEFQGVCFEQLSSNLQSPIYAAAKDWASAKAAYRLFDNDKVTSENILEPHRAQTVARVCKEQLVLAVQ